ncbi:LIC_13387 family protein [Pseudomonas sp. NFXW11]|uniref:LIC_13387 family protein n=1 Tax=Pseudomonas sp. NFXW11 TaxID=2819531 RepID=UPI003CEEF8CE
MALALIIASAAILLLLGSLHLFYTFASDKFQPRDPALAERMRQVSPIITRQTSLWRAWVGFNASHSLGAMLFGLVYGYLAWRHPALLQQARGLLVIGLGFLAGMWLLALRYWFRIPLLGISIALLLFAVASGLLCA